MEVSQNSQPTRVKLNCQIKNQTTTLQAKQIHFHLGHMLRYRITTRQEKSKWDTEVA